MHRKGERGNSLRSTGAKAVSRRPSRPAANLISGVEHFPKLAPVEVEAAEVVAAAAVVAATEDATAMLVVDATLTALEDDLTAATEVDFAAATEEDEEATTVTVEAAEQESAGAPRATVEERARTERARSDLGNILLYFCCCFCFS